MLINFNMQLRLRKNIDFNYKYDQRNSGRISRGRMILIPNNLRVINIGLRLFYQSLTEQKMKAVYVNWKENNNLKKKLETSLIKLMANK